MLPGGSGTIRKRNFSGEAIVRLDRQVECAMSGTIVFSGAAYLQLQVSAIESMDVVFVSSRQERISVLQ